jgi:hypothetical protein
MTKLEVRTVKIPLTNIENYKYLDDLDPYGNV